MRLDGLDAAWALKSSREGRLPEGLTRGAGARTIDKVKGEGEEPLPISSSYININVSCIFIFLEQEYRNPAFTFTLHPLRVAK